MVSIPTSEFASPNSSTSSSSSATAASTTNEKDKNIIQEFSSPNYSTSSSNASSSASASSSDIATAKSEPMSDISNMENTLNFTNNTTSDETLISNVHSTTPLKDVQFKFNHGNDTTNFLTNEKVSYNESTISSKESQSSKQVNDDSCSQLVEQSLSKLNAQFELISARFEKQNSDLKELSEFMKEDKFESGFSKLSGKVDELENKMESMQVKIERQIEKSENDGKETVQTIRNEFQAISELSKKVDSQSKNLEIVNQSVEKIKNQLDKNRLQYEKDQSNLITKLEKETNTKLETLSQSLDRKTEETTQSIQTCIEKVVEKDEMEKIVKNQTLSHQQSIFKLDAKVDQLESHLKAKTSTLSNLIYVLMGLVIVLIALNVMIMKNIKPTQSEGPSIVKCLCNHTESTTRLSNNLSLKREGKKTKLVSINVKVFNYGQGMKYDNHEELLDFLGTLVPNVEFTSNTEEKYKMNIVLKNVGIRRLEEDISFIDWKEFERKLPIPKPTLFLFVHNVDDVQANPLAFLLRDYIKKFPLSDFVSEISYDTGMKKFTPLEVDLKESIKSISETLM